MIKLEESMKEARAQHFKNSSKAQAVKQQAHRSRRNVYTDYNKWEVAKVSSEEQ